MTATRAIQVRLLQIAVQRRGRVAIVLGLLGLASWVDHAWLAPRGRDDRAAYHQRIARVAGVTDATTIEVDIADADAPTTRVRLIGVAPIAGGARQDDSQLAGQRTTDLAAGRLVRLLLDPNQPPRDADGAVRAYVSFENDPQREMLNEALVRDGFARTDGQQHPFRVRFESHERRARRQQLGLWGEATR